MQENIRGGEEDSSPVVALVDTMIFTFVADTTG
jgi:hypothetical protein